MFLEQEYEEHNTLSACVHIIRSAFSISILVTMPKAYWLCAAKQEQGNFGPLTGFGLLLMESRKQFTYVVRSEFHGTKESKVQSQFFVSQWCIICHCQVAD
jgi:hypothetical protein